MQPPRFAAPGLVLVAILKTARCHDSFPGRPFTVNVLGAEQEALARHFAGKPQLQEICWDASSDARLAGTLAVLECAPWATYDGGDHTLVVGRVTTFSYREGDGLGYFCGRFVRLDAPVLGIEFLF